MVRLGAAAHRPRRPSPERDRLPAHPRPPEGPPAFLHTAHCILQRGMCTCLAGSGLAGAIFSSPLLLHGSRYRRRQLPRASVPAVYMSHRSTNFRLFRLSDLVVQSFAFIYLCKWGHSHSPCHYRRHHCRRRPRPRPPPPPTAHRTARFVTLQRHSQKQDRI